MGGGLFQYFPGRVSGGDGEKIYEKNIIYYQVLTLHKEF